VVINGVDLTPPLKICEFLVNNRQIRAVAKGRDMERSSKRGKIPQQDWPSIIKRYEAGETLASIARTYDCSPPAISYILGRSRARDATGEGAEQSGIESPEPRLVKGHATDMPARDFINGAPEIGEGSVLPPTAQASDPKDGSDPKPVSAEPESASIGTERAPEVEVEIAVTEIPEHPAKRDMVSPAQAAPLGTGNSPGVLGTVGPQPHPGEARRTLHLSLSHDDAQPMETPPHAGHIANMADAAAARPVGDQQQGSTQHLARHHPVANAVANNGGAAHPMAESRKGRDGGTFIDRALRERVDGDISAFLAAFDAALADDTIESRADLREATDRLLRAGARTRIELERLEARVPLAARDTSGYSAPSWRPR
jgi:hypothetical protein